MPSRVPSKIDLRLIAASACAGLLSLGTAAADVLPHELVGDSGAVSRPLSPPTNESKPPAANSSSPAGTAGSLMTTCGALGMVLVLFLGLARLWKKQMPGGVPFLRDDVVEPLGQRTLGPKQAVQLVRVGSRILILGSSEEGLRTLSELTDPQEVEHLTQLCRDQRPSTEGFAFRAMYDQFVRRPAAAPTTTGAAPGTRLPDYAEAGHDA